MTAQQTERVDPPINRQGAVRTASTKSSGKAYDRRIREFQHEQRMNPIDWSDQAIGRVKDTQALMGRDRMREALANLGFPLK